MARRDSVEQSNESVNEEVCALFLALIDAWNERQATRYGELFAEDGSVVGFDGSHVEGRAAITEHVAAIFADHVTAPYIVKVREVRRLTSEVTLLRAVVGMVPPGQDDLNPDANAIQSLVATRRNGRWQINHFQNTPAAFHGRPELREALTDELRQLR